MTLSHLLPFFFTPMLQVSMKPRLGEYLALDVPGLAEGRPSVMIGDKIILSLPYADKYSTKYEGIVHEV